MYKKIQESITEGIFSLTLSCNQADLFDSFLLLTFLKTCKEPVSCLLGAFSDSFGDFFQPLHGCYIWCFRIYMMYTRDQTPASIAAPAARLA